MKRQIKKWALRLTVMGLFLASLLLFIVLNPMLTYANKTTHHNLSIYHNKTIDNSLLQQLDEASLLLKTSEFYRPGLKLDVCLNDGSLYPKLMNAIRGQAFAWGFYDKVVLQGTANCSEKYVGLNGYRWNLAQLLAHEMTHCFQFDKLGLLKSNPVANIPEWKWEGYAEYISRQNAEQKDLSQNLNRLKLANQADANSWAITFSDNTIAPRNYYNYWLLVQYCMDIRKMNYTQILADTTSEAAIYQEMMLWYNRQM